MAMYRPCDRLLVIIVTYNSQTLLRDLFSSLHVGLQGVEWSAIVSDNASTDRTVDTVKELEPECEIIQHQTNRGYAAGINAAIASKQSYSAFLILNPDVRLTPGFGVQLMNTLREQGVGIAVPRLLDSHGRLIASMRREPAIFRVVVDTLFGAERAGRWGRCGEMVTDPKRYQTPQRTDWAEGSTQLVSVECWQDCGPWDETYFLYSEETDFNLRARDAGYEVRFTPAATATHLEGSSATSPCLWSLLTMNKVRLYRSRHGLIKSGFFWLAVLVRETSRAVIGRGTSRAAVRALTSIRRWKTPPGPKWIEP